MFAYESKIRKNIAVNGVPPTYDCHDVCDTSCAGTCFGTCYKTCDSTCKGACFYSCSAKVGNGIPEY